MTLKRLTKRTVGGIARVCWSDKHKEVVGCYGCSELPECNSKMFERLAEYEDTGLTPEQIVELQKRREPQKPGRHHEKHKGVCPRCLSVEDTSANYCRVCAQALNWSDYIR